MWVKLHQTKNGLPRLVLPLDVLDRGVGDVVVDGLHPLGGERAGVLDGLLTDGTELLVVRLVRVLGEGLAPQHPAGKRSFVEPGELILVRVVELLGLLFGVQVIQVSVELVEAVNRRQVLVQVAEVVLAELPCRITQWLEQLGDGGILGRPANVHTGDADFAHSGAIDALPADERCASGRAALLTVGIGKAHPLAGNAIDIRRAVTHHAIAVATQVADADVVSPDHQDVRLAIRHGTPFAQPRPKQLCGMTLFGIRSGLGRFERLSVKIHTRVRSWSAVIVGKS
jgi:hypothetical protein